MAKTKCAADLKRGDGVILGPNDARVVESIEFTDRPIDSNGTQGVRVWWRGTTHASIIAADKELTTY